MKTQSLILIIFFTIFLSAIGQEATKLFDLSDVTAAKILEFEGEKVRVKGFVDNTRVNSVGIHYVEFKDNDFYCVTFARFVKNFEEGPPSEIYKDKWLEVTGEIKNYRGDPQIILSSSDQVKIIDEPAPPKPVEMTENVEKEDVSDDAEKKDENENPTPEVVPVAAVAEKNQGPVLEEIDGVPALDWRKYFPSGKDKAGKE